jgi:hypothetical protein
MFTRTQKYFEPTPHANGHDRRQCPWERPLLRDADLIKRRAGNLDPIIRIVVR